MYNYSLILKQIFKNRLNLCEEDINKKYSHINIQTGASTFASVLGWGQENGLINKNNVMLIPHPAGEYVGAIIQGDLFTLKCYELYKPWYEQLWKLTIESCGKYWIPITLFSFIQFVLTSLLPLVWSIFL